MTNYRITVTYDQDKELFRANAPELESCEAEAESRGEAVERLEQEIEARVENMRAQGVEPPRPIDEQELDGELSFHVSRSLHRDLLYRAKLEKVELEDYLSELLTRSLAARRSPSLGKGQGQGKRGRQREGQGQRYHDIMENRADFIEYVRRLDPGSTGGGGGGGGGGRRGGRRGKRRDRD